MKRGKTVRAGMCATCIALAAFLLSPGSTLAKDQTRPVVLVHGFEATSGSNCLGKWGDLMRMYRKWGFTGPFEPVRYYINDTPCPARQEFGTVQNPIIATGTKNTRIEDLAQDFAWFVYDRFSSRGIPVNAVAHSMGGLIVRYAISAVQRHNTAFPPFIVIPSVVTFGTPHNGVDTYWVGCAVASGNARQCKQINKSSNFIENLRANAPNPQGAYGTWWSVAGSHADQLVDEGSAIKMSVQYKIRWASGVGIKHGEYMHDQPFDAFNADAHCWSTTFGVPYEDMSEGYCYHPLQWSATILAAYGY
jgi:hypothetical protein